MQSHALMLSFNIKATRSQMMMTVKICSFNTAVETEKKPDAPVLGINQPGKGTFR